MESARELRNDSPKGKRTLSGVLIGPARDLRDPKLFHSLSLVAFLAWVGLGSDGLSSSNSQWRRCDIQFYAGGVASREILGSYCSSHCDGRDESARREGVGARAGPHIPLVRSASCFADMLRVPEPRRRAAID